METSERQLIAFSNPQSTSSPDKIACAPSPPAPRQCTPPRLAHSLRRTRLRPHSATRIHTQHVSCELLAATHTHNTLHCTCTFLHSAHNKRVMIFLDTASTTHAPRASNRFSHALRASTVLYCARTRNRELKWLHLCSLLRWHYNLTFCTVSCSRRIINVASRVETMDWLRRTKSRVVASAARSFFVFVLHLTVT